MCYHIHKITRKKFTQMYILLSLNYEQIGGFNFFLYSLFQIVFNNQVKTFKIIVIIFSLTTYLIGHLLQLTSVFSI